MKPIKSTFNIINNIALRKNTAIKKQTALTGLFEITTKEADTKIKLNSVIVMISMLLRVFILSSSIKHFYKYNLCSTGRPLSLSMGL